MKHLLCLLMTLSLLASCAKQQIKRDFSDSKWDTLKEESFLRFSEIRKNNLSDKTKKRYSALLKCYDGDHEDGLDEIRESLRGKPADEGHWVEIGLCHYLAGQYVKASYFFGLILSQSKSNYYKSLAHNNLGVIQLKMKRHDDAAAHFEQASSLSRRMKTPKFNQIQIYLKFHHYDKVLSQIRKLPRSLRKDPDLVLAKAIAFYHKGRPKNVLKEFKSLPREFKMRQDIGAYHAASLYELKRYRDAQTVLDRMEKPSIPEIESLVDDITQKVNIEIEKMEEASEG